MKVSSLKFGHEQEYEWLFFHWMPYDNDLWKHEVTVRNMLVRGVQSERILAVVVSDLINEEKLTRRVITNGHIIHEEVLAVADSSSAQIYADNLDWLRTRYHAKQWAIVFLGHGGRLDEITECVQCNELCYGNLSRGEPIACSQWDDGEKQK